MCFGDTEKKKFQIEDTVLYEKEFSHEFDERFVT